MNGILSGLRVVEGSAFVAAPLAGMTLAQMGADVIRIEGQGNTEMFVETLNALPFTQTISAANNLIQVGVDSGNRRLVEVVTVAGEQGFRIEDISVAKPSLGDVFLNFTGRQFRD